MKVIIDQTVHLKLNEFYEIALQIHPALDKKTIAKKMDRLFSELDKLGRYATIYNKARLNSLWIQNGYRECVIEDVHFAFQIYKDDESGQPYVYIHDVCHSYLYKE